jgi:hypothetical protein
MKDTRFVHQLREDISRYLLCGERIFPATKRQISTNNLDKVTCPKCLEARR